MDSGSPTRIIAIVQNASAGEAAKLMMAHGVGCLIVTDGNGKYAGIITERDIVGRVVASGKSLEQTSVAEAMTTEIVTCAPDTPAGEARKIMAANKIRHLPIVQNGIVVGMLSARDLMGQQLQEDRAAAEEVAMLSNCLKSIDFNEVANIVTTEVPRLFHANRCILCLWKEAVGSTSPELVSSNECLCPHEHLNRPGNVGEMIVTEQTSYDNTPEVCEKHNATSPRLVIPITVTGMKDSMYTEGTQLSGYLCMCGLALSSVTNKELISYKAKLAKEILNAHLSNARLYQEARIRSVTDPLTGVGSRKLLEDKLEAECARAKRYKRPFSVAIIDLDNFKTVNDVLGHAAGDDALRQLATCMKNQKRTPDILTRYGGDEFVVLMPETKAEDARVLIERLRSKVRGIALAENLSMTISCGIAASSPDCLDSSSEVMRRADLALYEAKSAGRDCIKIWTESMSKRLSATDVEIEKIKKLQRRIAGLSEQAEAMFIQSIWGLVQALEAKDPYAKRHSEHVMAYSVAITQTMSLGPKQTEIIRRAAMIHDIGKIGVSDSILLKPGSLAPNERNIIQQHPLIAVRILKQMSFLEQEIDIVRHHHEKWNGHGYPDGIQGRAIPLGARIIAVADTFDALTSDRSYHICRSVKESLDILVDSAGYDYDPKVVDALVGWVQNIREQSGSENDPTPADLLAANHDADVKLTVETTAQPAGASAK